MVEASPNAGYAGNGEEPPPTEATVRTCWSLDTAVTARRYSRLVARTARRDVIGLLIEKQVTYTEVEADALIAQAKKLAKESGRTVRAEAELLLSRDRETRLRDLLDKVLKANKLLAAITVEVDDLRAESGDDDGELAAIMATMATSCGPFVSPSPDKH
jgi:hypothetical protein